MRNELLSGSRAVALREVLRSLECDAATRELLEQFVPDVPGIKPYLAALAGHSDDLLRALATAGAGFCIDQVRELDPLRARGVDPRAVLYRNPSKRAEDVRHAALRGVWRFAVDTESELHVIGGAAPGAAIYVYVAVQGATRSSGAGASAHEALRLLRLAPELGVRPHGLAFNVGSHERDAATYARALERCGLVMRRLEQLGTRIEMLVLGGRVTPDPEGRAVATAVSRLPYRPALLVAEP